MNFVFYIDDMFVLFQTSV